MRNSLFYKNVFGYDFDFGDDPSSDYVKFIDVDNIKNYKMKILNLGGDLTVSEIELRNHKKIAYFSDPDGNIFALLENDK